MRELWLARNTVVEILGKRGYPTAQKTLNYAEFTAQYPTAAANAAALNFIAVKNDPLAIHFTTDEKLSKAALESVLGGYSQQGIIHVILITPSKLNPSCKMLLKSSPSRVEHFVLQELQFNVLKHELVPPHRILQSAETADLLKRLRTDVNGLPIILTTDIVCRYVGGCVGDIMEIVRDSLTTGKSIYYRTVKDP